MYHQSDSLTDKQTEKIERQTERQKNKQPASSPLHSLSIGLCIHQSVSQSVNQLVSQSVSQSVRKSDSQTDSQPVKKGELCTLISTANTFSPFLSFEDKNSNTISNRSAWLSSSRMSHAKFSSPSEIQRSLDFVWCPEHTNYLYPFLSI